MAAVIREQRRPSEWPALRPITDATGPTLYCVHSISGDILEYMDLARWMGPDRAFVGIQAKLGSDVSAIYETIPTTAAAYVAEILARQPTGPYFLAGWSSGGTVAFEMAQQLLAAGEKVALLAILDSAPHNTGFTTRWWSPLNLLLVAGNIPKWIRNDLLQSSWADLAARVRQKVTVVSRRARAVIFGGGDERHSVRDVVNFPKRTGSWETFVERHYRALRAYVPQPYAGRVTLFKATTHPLLTRHESEAMWRRLTTAVDVRRVPGTHFSIVKDPNVRTLASALSAAVDEAAARDD